MKFNLLSFLFLVLVIMVWQQVGRAVNMPYGYMLLGSFLIGFFYPYPPITIDKNKKEDK